MRNSLNITRGYQFGYMLVHHLIALLVIIVIQLMICLYFLDNAIASNIIAGIFSVIYGGFIYSSARKLSILDGKSYTPLKQELKWGVLWGIVISATIALAIIMFKINWSVFRTSDNSLLSHSFIFINFLFYILTSPFLGFTIGTEGNINILLTAVMLIIPVAASILGYKAGISKFDILEKLYSLTLEKNREDDKDDTL